MAAPPRQKRFPQIIRDSVHNIVHFDDNDCDRLLLRLINTNEFQRLRRIKQLGFSELVFPGANHSRLSHSIGVMHVARKMFDRLNSELGGTLTHVQRLALCTAALLHDVGHGPFSHAFEKATGDDHEVRTTEIIRDPSTEIHSVLSDTDSALPQSIVSFFESTQEPGQGIEIPSYLNHIVSSQLDADRFDYLLRDSHSTGAEYGQYDLQWLLTHLYVDTTKNRLFLDRKAFYATERYVFARYHMYQSVYYHKTTRSAEVMLKRLLETLRILGNNDELSRWIPELPDRLQKPFKGERVPLPEYLLLDDVSLTELFKFCSISEHHTLSSLGSGLIGRKLFKCLDLTDHIERHGDFQRAADAVIRQRGRDPDDTLLVDRPTDTPYRPYNPDQEQPAKQIYIENRTGTQSEISSISDPVKQLLDKITLIRFYFPAEFREDMERVRADTLG